MCFTQQQSDALLLEKGHVLFLNVREPDEQQVLACFLLVDNSTASFFTRIINSSSE